MPRYRLIKFGSIFKNKETNPQFCYGHLFSDKLPLSTPLLDLKRSTEERVPGSAARKRKEKKHEFINLIQQSSIKAVRSRCETADDQLAEDFARG